jgi:hypothetical protein
MTQVISYFHKITSISFFSQIINLLLKNRSILLSKVSQIIFGNNGGGLFRGPWMVPKCKILWVLSRRYQIDLLYICPIYAAFALVNMMKREDFRYAWRVLHTIFELLRTLVSHVILDDHKVACIAIESVNILSRIKHITRSFPMLH